jgi:hypothetical protein
MRDKFSAVSWLAIGVYFAGLVFVFFTENVRIQILFNFAASSLVCLDSFMFRAQPKLSLLDAHDDVKPRFHLSPLMLLGFGFLVAGCITVSHTRISAVLMALGICFLALDRYAKTNSIAASK